MRNWRRPGEGAPPWDNPAESTIVHRLPELGPSTQEVSNSCVARSWPGSLCFARDGFAIPLVKRLQSRGHPFPRFPHQNLGTPELAL